MSTSEAAALSPLIAAQLNYALANSPIPLKVEHLWSGGKSSSLTDRFTLMIPFCLEYIKWDFIYNALFPLASPDVVFAPEDEGFCPLVLAAGGGVAIRSLVDWNLRDPSRLLALVNELREAYMQYQMKRVEELQDARLMFEINTVLSRKGMEVLMFSGLDRPEEVKFAIPLLDMDLNKLVPVCPWRHEQRIYLQAVFPVIRRYSSAPAAPQLKLISSQELKSLFSVEDIKLPVWIDGMCMAEYLPMLEEDLKIQLVEAAASVGARRRFIEALAPVFGRPLEADQVLCRRATVLSTSNSFIFLVHFSLPTQFPKQQPTLIMQSTQHFNSQGAPLTSPPINDYPWSPRWDMPQMIERIFDFLADECLNFKKHCSDAVPPPQL